VRVIPDLLTAAECHEIRRLLAEAPWQPGATTAGAAARAVKANMQVDATSEQGAEAGRRVRAALERTPLFVSAALPARISQPVFSRYGDGQAYGAHVDNAIRFDGDSRLRADVSATLFLSDPHEYAGGELVIESGSATQRVKLPAGALLVYPSTSLHRVEPVTSGERMVSVVWVQSFVRDAAARDLLFELDAAIQSLGEHPAALRLGHVYHNLLRRWAA
jgi:PKHD-type hydroxylase